MQNLEAKTAEEVVTQHEEAPRCKSNDSPKSRSGKNKKTKQLQQKEVQVIEKAKEEGQNGF